MQKKIKKLDVSVIKKEKKNDLKRKKITKTV